MYVRESGLTHRSHNLRLHPELILKPAREIAHPSFTIRHHIWHLADMIEHVPAGEEQDGDEGDGSPEIAVLDDGQDVRCRDREECDET